MGSCFFNRIVTCQDTDNVSLYLKGIFCLLFLATVFSRTYLLKYGHFRPSVICVWFVNRINILNAPSSTKRLIPNLVGRLYSPDIR